MSHLYPDACLDQRPLSFPLHPKTPSLTLSETIALDRLPIETKISRILHNSDHSSKDDCSSLIQVARYSRQYYDLATPILYPSFKGGYKSRALAFLLAIISRPELAVYAQCVEGLRPESDKGAAKHLIDGQPRCSFDITLPGLKTALEKVCNENLSKT